jgi:hypothetical protein
MIDRRGRTGDPPLLQRVDAAHWSTRTDIKMLDVEIAACEVGPPLGRIQRKAMKTSEKRPFHGGAYRGNRGGHAARFIAFVSSDEGICRGRRQFHPNGMTSSTSGYRVGLQLKESES